MIELSVARNEQGLCAVAGCTTPFVENFEVRGKIPAQFEDGVHIESAHITWRAEVCRFHYRELTLPSAVRAPRLRDE